jgi:ABC-type spermidine/putrescine transport system permease subunit I
LERRKPWLPLMPALAILVGLLAAPLFGIAGQSLRLFIPGHVGVTAEAPYTWRNYTELLQPAYLHYFADTYRIGFEASVIALIVSYPISYRIARLAGPMSRRIWIILLVSLIFLSILVRVYSVALTFGPSAFGQFFANLLGVTQNSREYAEVTIIAGLLHFLIPMSALALVGAIQNVNPRLLEAAQALGAPRWRAHLRVTLPLSARGIVSAFMLCYTYCISAFVIPMVLGKGRVLFVSNLIYSRFGDVGDYPGASAIALVMLGTSLMLLFLIARLTSHRWKYA